MNTVTPRFAWMVRHPITTFFLMCAAFLLSGTSSYQLVALLYANIHFLFTHGWLAVMEGGLWQLGELSLLTLLAVFGYLSFKTCEHALVQRFAHPTN